MFQPTAVGKVGQRSACLAHRSNAETALLSHLTPIFSNFTPTKAKDLFLFDPSNHCST